MFTDLPKFVFFTGKGGVGKTSLACATSLSLVDAGHRVLLVSTDPASNVGQVFETDIGNKITPIKDAKDREANYTLDGTLTLKGITEKISFPAYIAMENGTVTANGAMTFDRTKYNIKVRS